MIFFENIVEDSLMFHGSFYNVLLEFSLRMCIQELPKGNIESSGNAPKAMETIMSKDFDGKEKLS